MNFFRDSAKLDTIVPGVTDAYRQLRQTSGMGIYTSLGAFYNHTIFGRDVAMSAKFVSDIDHEVVWETIQTLASMQGMDDNARTQEELGRIHHEMRDYTTWSGRPMERFGMWWAGRAWGAHNKKLLTYYAADTTANYIRLINKYVHRIDASILTREVSDKRGNRMSVAISVERAAEWIMSHVDETGILVHHRRNRLSLPYQTFQDSVTAYTWSDGRPCDTSHPHCYIEVQAFAIDALEDAAQMLSGHERARIWQRTSDLMQEALMREFWHERQQFFGSMIVRRGTSWRLASTPNIATGWILNTSFWERLPPAEYRARMIATLRKLLSEDFLTPVGIRTRTRRAKEPLGRDIDYHGSRTVWPMFNFMVIEGLRRHGLYRLAAELESRLIAGVNAIGQFPEFMIVDHDGTLYRPDRQASYRRAGQMVPEVNIAFTVVPMIALAHRAYSRVSHHTHTDWRSELEDEILGSLGDSELPDPRPLRITRVMSGLRSARFILPVMLRRPHS